MSNVCSKCGKTYENEVVHICIKAAPTWVYCPKCDRAIQTGTSHTCKTNTVQLEK